MIGVKLNLKELIESVIPKEIRDNVPEGQILEVTFSEETLDRSSARWSERIFTIHIRGSTVEQD